MAYKLISVTAPPPVGAITLPAWAVNPVGTGVSWNGGRAVYSTDPYNFINFELGAHNDRWVDYVNGNNSNAGTSSGTAWKTIPFAIANTPSPGVINILDSYIGYENKGVIATLTVNGLFKFKSVAPGGRTRWVAMRESRNQASFSWQSVGSAGCWKSSTSSAKDYRAQFDPRTLDSLFKMPTPILRAGSIDEAVTTPLRQFWDSATSALYVNLPDGAMPDPFVNWLYTESPYRHEFQQTDTAGILLFENCDFLSNNATTGDSGANVRFRMTNSSPTMLANTASLGFDNCLMYGGASNNLALLDTQIMALRNTFSRYAGADNFNYHNSKTDGGKGDWQTAYEDGCWSLDAGYTGFFTHSGNSHNGSTTHDNSNIFRANSIHARTRGACIADVNNVGSLNYGCGAGVPGGGAPNALFWHDRYNGAGTSKGMVVWGCYQVPLLDPNSYATSDIQQAGGAGNKGYIEIGYWGGTPTRALDGTAYNLSGVPL